VTLRGEPYLLWRAVDEHGAELDILLQKRRDKAAAKRFFKRVLRSSPVPRKIVTDQLRSYPAAKGEIPELANVKHVFVKAAARLNNRAENSHQPTRERERRIPRGLPSGRARLSRPETHTKIALVLRADTATLRIEAASSARLTVSQTACSKVRCMARIRRTRPRSVDCLLTSRHACCPAVSLSAT
jgi:transposase-like protein